MLVLVMDTLLSALQIYGSISATVKHGLRTFPPINDFCKNSASSFLLTLICWILSSVILIILITILVPLWLYKTLITFILQQRHGDNFAGVLQSGDSMWLVEDETALNIINLVLIVQFDKSKENLLEYAKTICKNRFFKSKRLASVRKTFMGYGYFLCNQISVEDIVSSVKISTTGVCDERDLKKFVSKYANLPLPKENTASLQVVVCEDRILFENEDNSIEQYALLLRAHHSVGDGCSFMSLLIRDVADEGASLIQESLKAMALKKQNFDFAEYFKQILKKMCNSDSYINTLFTPPDRNPFRPSRLMPQKNVAFRIETGDGVMVERIRKIKKKLNCTFSVVVYTAVSASLYDYFKTNNPKDIPENFMLTFMVMPEREAFHYQHTDIKNIASFGNIRLPIKDATLPDTLNTINQEHQKYVDSCDSWICYWQLKTFCNLLPHPLIRHLMRRSTITTSGFTNMPGIKKVKIGGHIVNYKFFWVPNFVTTGAGFSISTYDNKLQMGFLVDKGLVPNEDEAQRLLDNVYINIDKMYDIVCKTE